MLPPSGYLITYSPISNPSCFQSLDQDMFPCSTPECYNVDGVYSKWDGITSTIKTYQNIATFPKEGFDFKITITVDIFVKSVLLL